MYPQTVGLWELVKPQRDRWQRALSDSRICVLDVAPLDDASSYLLTMQGTTDVYSISVPNSIGVPMKCNCFDAKKRKDLVCKHVLKACLTFGLLKNDIDDEAITALHEDSKILRDLVNGDSLTLNALEIERLQVVFRNRLRSSASAGPSGPTGPTAESALEDPCAVCFEPIDAGSPIFKCVTCKNCVHGECWAAWKRAGKRTCVYCRAVC